MTASGESQKETTGMKLEVLSAKTKTRLGFWNVRTMYETGKLALVTAEIRLQCAGHLKANAEEGAQKQHGAER